MKRALALSVFVCSFLGFAANAADLHLTPKVKRILCARMQRVIPTEDGRVLPIADCLRGQFSQSGVKRDRFIIEWNGQTVEDVSTVCEVEFAKNPADIARLNPASCDMQ